MADIGSVINSKAKEALQDAIDKYRSTDSSDKIVSKIRSISSAMNTLSNFKKIGSDFFKNMSEKGAKDLRAESLSPQNFVLYIDSSQLPDTFKVSPVNNLLDTMLTKVGDVFDVMRIRIVDGSPNNIANNLFFLVNPSSMQFNQEKSYSDFITRTGSHAEYWGNKPVELSFDGTSGGFYGLDDVGSGYGVGNFMRTLSFSNIMSLVTFYKNNGFVMGQGGIDVQGTNKGSTLNQGLFFKDVQRVDMVEITYRDTVFWGSFGSMSLTYSSTSPNKISYSFNFTAYRHTVVSG